jgi:hypothetical protein
MSRHDRARQVTGALLAGGLLAGTPAAALAAGHAASSTGWRVVLTARFGAASDKSGFDAVLAHSTDAWVFGGTNFSGAGSPVAEHWTAGKWQVTPMPTGLSSWITAASSVSLKSVWAVGRLGGYVLNWTSTGGWSQVTSGGWKTGTQFTGITAITQQDVWVFGASGTKTPGAGTWNYLNGKWVQYTGVGGDIYQASALSATSIWAIGGVSGSRNAVLTYDATTNTWQQITDPALAGLTFNFVWAQSPTSVWVGGSIVQSGILKPKLVHWNGSKWTRIAVPGAVAPTSITADGGGGIWVVANPSSGAASLLNRSATGQWSTVQVSFNTNQRIEAVARVHGSTAVWGAGIAPAKTGRNAAIYEYGTAP